MTTTRAEHGASALLVAGALMFIFGAAALAVDTSSLYQDARSNQTVADMACLAGLAELPDTNAAINAAAEIADLNWAGSTFGVPTVSGTTGVASDGSGNVLTIEANHNGSPDAMSVEVSEVADTNFAGVMGANSIVVTQDAVCGATNATSAKGVMPLGALAGTFSGDLFDCAAKVTGNCGALAPAGNGANVWRDALEDGSDVDVQKHHGNWTSNDADMGIAGTECVSAGQTCNAMDTESGNMTGPFNQGIANLLSNISGADCVEGGDFNCDSMTQVLGGSAGTLASYWPSSPPADFAGYVTPNGWQTSLYGPYSSAKNNQYYYNGTGIKCDSPRLATIPIVDHEHNNYNHWDLGDPNSSWPNGNKMMKVIGFYTVYIREPANRSDVGNGGGNGLNQIVADVVWFGPDATCEDGSLFAPLGSINVPSDVKLIAG
ncbi:MAG: Tad domain-containing protein [Acidimicrobiia bacterium]|nr:Tad domain-containing protein [Acidimicrobiia bacterium]